MDPELQAQKSSTDEYDDDDTGLIQLGYQPRLRRALGFFSNFALQFTVVAVAAGLMLTFGLGWAQIGPALFWAWLIGGALQMLVAISVGVGFSAFPLAGGPFQVISKLNGPRIGWHAGWMLLVGVIAGLSSEVVFLAPYYASWFGINAASGPALIIASIILVAVCSAINLAGVKVAAFVNNITVFLEGLAIVVVVLVLPITLIVAGKPAQSVGFLFTTGGVQNPGANLALPFLLTLLVPVFVVSGFYASGTTSEETKNASRTVPKALWTSALISTVVGAVMIFLLSIAVINPHATATADNPMLFILEGRLGPTTAKAFEVFAVLALTVNAVVLQLVAARMVWAFSRDKLLPGAKLLDRLNSSQVPTWGILIVGLVAIGLFLWTSLLNVLVALSALLSALPIALMIFYVLRARRRGQFKDGPFSLGRMTTPVMVIAISWSVAFSLIQILQDPLTICVGIASVVIAGIIFEFSIRAYQRKHPVNSAVEGAR